MSRISRSAMCELVVAILQLQEAAEAAGLQSIDLQLTGKGDHIRLHQLADELQLVRTDYRPHVPDMIAGAKIYPARNEAGT